MKSFGKSIRETFFIKQFNRIFQTIATSFKSPFYKIQLFHFQLYLQLVDEKVQMKPTKVSLINRKQLLFAVSVILLLMYLQNVGKKEEVLVIKLQFVVVSVLLQPQLCKVMQRFFPQKSRESKNVIHSDVCVTISNPEVDICSIQKRIFCFCLYISQ